MFEKLFVLVATLKKILLGCSFDLRKVSFKMQKFTEYPRSFIKRAKKVQLVVITFNYKVQKEGCGMRTQTFEYFSEILNKRTYVCEQKEF